VAAVPQEVPKTCWAVLDTPVTVAWETGYLVRSEVPILLRNLLWAKATNSGDSKVVRPLVVLSERSSWVETKKKVWSR